MLGNWKPFVVKTLFLEVMDEASCQQPRSCEILPERIEGMTWEGKEKVHWLTQEQHYFHRGLSSSHRNKVKEAQRGRWLCWHLALWWLASSLMVRYHHLFVSLSQKIRTTPKGFLQDALAKPSKTFHMDGVYSSSRNYQIIKLKGNKVRGCMGSLRVLVVFGLETFSSRCWSEQTVFGLLEQSWWWKCEPTFLMLLLCSSLLELTALLWETLLVSFSLAASDRLLGASEFKSFSSASFSPTLTEWNTVFYKIFISVKSFQQLWFVLYKTWWGQFKLLMCT